MEKVQTRSGTYIAFERSGTGPPLLLVHGAVTNHTIWSRVLPALGNYFTVYALDRRGRGESGEQGHKYSIVCEYEDIADVINSIGEPVYLLGHSSGARYALHASLLTPLVRKLVLYEPPPLHAASPEIVDQLQYLHKTGDSEGLLTTFLHKVVGLSLDQVARQRSTPIWQMQLANAMTLTQEVRSFAQYVFDPSQFKTMHIPTLLLLGGKSPAFYKHEIDILHTVLPNSRAVVLPGQGHGAMNTAPDLFVEEVVDFLIEHH